MAKIIHKLHLYLGLLASLVLMVVSFSGAILSYEKELLRLVHSDSFTVTPTASRLTNEALIERFLEQRKGAKINAITLSKEPNEAVIINIASQKSRKGESIFINPYTAEILPEVSTHKFFKFVENIHRRLLLGEVGKQIVGASVLILIFLLFSGVYMYMPKIKRGFVKALTFSPRAKGRSFLYSLHGAVGLWVVPIYLSITLTGLYWSYHWYNDMLHSLTGVEQHKRPPMKKEGAKRESAKKESMRATRVQKEMTPAPQNQPQNIAKALELFHTHIGECYATLTLRTPRDGGAIYSYFSIDKDPAHPYARNMASINIQTQALIKDTRYEDKSIAEKLMASIFALHSGEFFGWVGQLLFFIAALMMPVLAITGFLLFIKKRRAKYAH